MTKFTKISAKNFTEAIRLLEGLISIHYKTAKLMDEHGKTYHTEAKELNEEISNTHKGVAGCLEVIVKCLKDKPEKKVIAKKREYA